MFERFDPSAHQTVMEARAQASRLQQAPVGTHHLLLALLSVPGPVADSLRAGGVTVDAVEAAVTTLAGESPTEADRDRLGSLGIDLDRVRSGVEASFGRGALERARLYRLERGRRRWRGHRGWRGRCRLAHIDSTPWGPRAKKVLELSLREALRLKSTTITPQHIGLGLLREGEGLACAILARRGLSFVELRQTWEASSSAAA